MAQKKCTSSNSSNNPSYQSIPQDIIDTHILTKLPIRSIHRFKSISKHYNSLISTPTFAKNLLQLYLNSASPSMFIHTTRDNAPSKFLTLDIEPEPNAPDRIDILGLSVRDHGYDLGEFKQLLIGSCNGLVCMRLDPKEYIDARGKHTFFMIWNPMTRETRVIKFPVISYQSRFICSGFGYDSSSDDYTIVALVQAHFITPCVYLFSLRSTNDSSWRRVDDAKLNNMSQVGRPTLAGETLYWPVIDKKFDNSDDSYIAAFNLGTNSWRVITLPDHHDGSLAFDNKELILCEIKQRLCACWVYNIDKDHQNMEAWWLEWRDGVLERYDEVMGYWNLHFYTTNLETRYNNECHLFVPWHHKHMVSILSVDNLLLLLPHGRDGYSFKRAVNFTKSLISPFYNWSFHPRTRKGCLDALKKKADE